MMQPMMRTLQLFVSLSQGRSIEAAPCHALMAAAGRPWHRACILPCFTMHPTHTLHSNL